MAENTPDIHNEVNDLIRALEESNSVPDSGTPVAPTEVKPEDVEQYVINSNTAIVNSCMEMLAKLQSRVLAGGEPRDVEAFSALTKTTVDALDNMNKMVLQQKKSETALKVKQLETGTMKEIAGTSATNTTNIIISTREDIMRSALAAIEASNKTIDI